MYVVPEVATMLFAGGATIPKTHKRTLAFQSSLLKAQISLEDSFYKIAESTGEPSLILCDRGVMDGRGYMSERMWGELMGEIIEGDGRDGRRREREGHWEEKLVELRDGRYDLVVHMVTAAEGAEGFYGFESNEVRFEGVEEARVVDGKLREAWVGHPQLRIVDNRTGFKEKIERVFKEVAGLFGLVVGGCKKRKFLVKGRKLSRVGERAVGLKEVLVEQTFLERGDSGEGVEESVRSRGRGGFFTFVHQVRRLVRGEDGVEVVELKRQINNREYLSLLSHADPTRRSVRIRRQCFLFKGQYFVLDTPLDVTPEVQLLRTRVECGVKNVLVPDWIHVEKEVTGQVEWTVYNMSMRVNQVRIMQGLGPGDDEFSRKLISKEALFGTSL